MVQPGRVTAGWPFVGRGAELEMLEAAYRDPGVPAAVVVGPPGVGKTRLAEECRRHAERDGAPTFRAIGTETASSVPLGALAHLIPPELTLTESRGGGSPADVVTVTHAVMDQLAPAGPDGPLPLLVVDDAQLLDPFSLVVMTQIVASGRVFVLATVRSTAEVPDAVTSLWRSGRSARLELRELGQDQVEALLHIALGGPVHADTAQTYWTYSQGNVLVLHELVLDALERGALENGPGGWRLTGPLLSEDRAPALVEARLAGLDEQSRRVLELVTVADELDVEGLEERFPVDVLEQLEHQCLVAVGPADGRTVVRVGHPLYAEAVRAGLATVRLRQLRRDAIELLARHGAPRRIDRVRIMVLQVDNGDPANPAALRLGALLARQVNDHPTVERLARLAHQAEPGPVSGRLLGEALFEAGRFSESLDVLERSAPLAATADERFALAFARANTLYLGLGRGGDALDVLQALADDPLLEALRADIELRRAGLAVWVGRVDEAAAAIAHAQRSQDPAVYLELDHARQAIALVRGRASEALEMSQASYQEHLRHPDLLAWVPPVMHRLNTAWALVELCRYDEARVLLEDLRAEASVGGLAGPRRWFTIERGRIELAVGRLVQAQWWFTQASDTAAAGAQPRAERLALAGVAMAAGQRGDAEAAAAAIARLDLVPGDTTELADTEWDRGRAWAVVAEGHVSRGLRILDDAAQRAQDTGRRLFELRLRHTAVRLGRGEDLGRRLAELAQQVDTPLAQLAADHAAALRRHDADGLERAAERYAALGNLLWAAEAAAQGGDAARHQGDQRRATALSLRSSELRDACEEPRTPALAHSQTVSPLSPREREIALLVAGGASNREIGERLYLSVRTVENHVRNVFLKLGISRRAEMAEALGLHHDI